MQITWHGHTCFKIIGKSNGDEITIALDPYTNALGLRAPRFEADIVLLNNNQSEELDASSIGGTPFLVNSPGEYEVKKVYIEGVQAFRDNEQGAKRGYTTLFNINFEDIHIVHLGYLGVDLNDSQVERLENCDILMIPVGGNDVLSTQQAMHIISQLEPVVVIPMYYNIAGVKVACDPIDAFAKEFGLKVSETEPKLKVVKKDLAEGGMKAVILERM